MIDDQDAWSGGRQIVLAGHCQFGQHAEYDSNYGAQESVEERYFLGGVFVTRSRHCQSILHQYWYRADTLF